MIGYRTLASGLRGPEGPVAMADGSVAIVESMASQVTLIAASGTTSVLAPTGGGPNGMARDADGTLLVANNGGIGHPTKQAGALQRCRDGATSVVVGGLDAPNDVCLGADGAVWFTDPRDNWYQAQLRPGRVFRWDGELTLVHEGLDYPNGIGFCPDGLLVVAESRTGWLHRLEHGALRRWLHCGDGAPDGFCFDTAGNCYVCCFDTQAIYVFDGEGTLVRSLRTETGTMPTNCALAPDGSLVVTESAGGRVLAFDIGADALAALGA